MSIADDFSLLSKELTQMKLSHVWDGYAGTVFLEFGQLSKSIKSDGTAGNPNGEISIGIEWNWQLLDKNSTICTSEDAEDRWIAILKELVGANIVSLDLVGQPPELELNFNSGQILVSVADDEDEPTWMIIDHGLPGAHGFEVKDGKLSY